MRTALLVLAVCVLAACSSTGSAPSAAARGVVVVDGDPSALNRDCKLLGTVSGRSLFGGSDEARVQTAMSDAREKAAGMGATHVVFIEADTKGMLSRGNAQARAYRCDVKPS